MLTAEVDYGLDDRVGLTKLIRRSRLEVRMDILKGVSDGPTRPTHLMYRANLAWTTLQEHVGGLITKGLLSETKDEEGRTTYELTSKGLATLSLYLNILDAVGKVLVEQRPW